MLLPRISTVFALLFCCHQVMAASGDLDTSFNTSGLATGPAVQGILGGYSVIQQADGKLVVAGQRQITGTDIFIARYNSNGSLDTGFNSTGYVATTVCNGCDGYAKSVIQQTDGKLVVAGYSVDTNIPSVLLVRYNSNGSLDTTFNSTGIVTTTIGLSKAFAVVQLPDGKLMVAGNDWTGSGFSMVLLRYNSNGSLDTAFNSTGSVIVNYAGFTGYSFTRQSDGKLVIAGGLYIAYHPDGDKWDFALARFNSDGSLDTTFNSTGMLSTSITSAHVAAIASSVIQQADGKLLAAGSIGSYVDSSIVLIRYNGDGSLDTTFNSTGVVTDVVTNAVAHSVIQQSDGKLVVGGTRPHDNLLLARFSNNGLLDSSFNGSGVVTTSIYTDTDGQSLIQQADGKLVMTGYNYHTIQLARYESGMCLLGNYWNGTVCVITPIGTYVDIYGATTPTTCPAGTYNTVTGNTNSNSCLQNSAGTYSTNGVRILCPAGTYNPDTGSTSISSCLPTPAGSYTDAGASSYATTPAGTYSPGGILIQCPAGTYNPDTGSTSISSCLPTPAGSYTDAGASSYATTPAGTYSPNGVLIQCPAGTYNPDTGSTGINSCLQTPAGSSSAAGAPSPTTCAAGSYSNLPGSGTCTNAPAGTYVPASGATSTTPCAAGTYNPSTGSTSSNSCLQTPAGSYSAAGAASPTVCAPGSYSNAAGSSTCTTSPTGTYVASSGASAPTLCPAGTYNPDTGSTSSNSCVQTPAGSYSATGAAAATLCPAGESSYAGATSSANCFADADGNGIPPAVDTNSMGMHAGDHAGTSTVLADINNDGVADIIVGAPDTDVLVNGKLKKNAGSLVIISGADGSILNALVGLNANEQLGTSIAVTYDLDSDGMPDLVLGFPLYDPVATVNGKSVVLKNAGAVVILSSATGALWGTYFGTQANEHFGAALAVADINNDHYLDLIVGSPFTNYPEKGAGQITVFNAMGNIHDLVHNVVLYKRYGVQAGEHFGSAIAIDKVNNQVLVGSPDYDSTVVDAGRVQIFNAADGNSGGLLSLVGQTAKGKLGSAVTSFNQDLDGDSQTDWAVGIPGAGVLNSTTGKIMPAAGRVEFFSGTNTTPLAQGIDGAAAGDYFGKSLSADGDVNKDSKHDIAVGSPGYDVSALVNGKTVILKDAGRVEVMSSSALFQ